MGIRGKVNNRTKFSPKKKMEEVQWFYDDFEELSRQKGKDTTFSFGSMYPILSDRNEPAGTTKGHYFHQDFYVARQIFLSNPKKHLDIGSRIDGFVAHVASFRPIELIDIRDIQSNMPNISFRQANLMQLSPDLINYCDSISSLHAIEHFGLGRYGDPIDYLGHLKAISNIRDILVSGGTFYLSVPIGPQRIEFNAHRVFSLNYLLGILSLNFITRSFSYIDDSGSFHENVKLTPASIESNFDCIYGCGIFILQKI